MVVQWRALYPGQAGDSTASWADRLLATGYWLPATGYWLLATGGVWLETLSHGGGTDGLRHTVQPS